MNPLFIYRGITDGHIVVANLEDARQYEDSELFVHIATIDARQFLQHLLNNEPMIMDRYIYGYTY